MGGDLFVFRSGMDKDNTKKTFIKDNCCLFVNKEDIDEFIEKFIISNPKNEKVVINYFVFKDDFRIIQESFNRFNIDRGILKCSKNDNFELILINCYRTQSDQKTHRVIHRLTKYKNYKYVDENEVKNLIT